MECQAFSFSSFLPPLRQNRILVSAPLLCFPINFVHSRISFVHFLHFYLHNSKFFRIFALVFSPRQGYVLRLWEGCGHIKGVFLRFVLAFRNLANSN